MSRIYLIRHGRTPANDEHRYCGSTDLPLSPAGIDELGTLRYENVSGSFVISGMKRTLETLKFLFGNVSYSVDPGLREIDFGSFEMKTYEELRNDPDYIRWLDGDNEKNTPPGGESGEAMTGRVLQAFDKYKHADEDFVIISHGGVIAAIMAYLFPCDGKDRYQWQPAPGHGYCIEEGRYRPVP